MSRGPALQAVGAGGAAMADPGRKLNLMNGE